MSPILTPAGGSNLNLVKVFIPLPSPLLKFIGVVDDGKVRCLRLARVLTLMTAFVPASMGVLAWSCRFASQRVVVESL